MALGSLPPWLQISPRDYLLATQAGVQAGHAIAESTQRAWEQEQQMRMAEERQKTQLAQQAIENAAQRLAADRLEQYRQSEVANRKAELGIQQQGLGLRGEGLDIQRQKIEDLSKSNQQKIIDAEQRQKDRQTQVDFMNQMREREAERRDREFERREKESERSRQGHFINKDGVDYVIPPGGTNAIPVNFPEDKKDSGPSTLLPNLLKAGGGLLRAGLGVNPLLHPAAQAFPMYGGQEPTPSPSMGTIHQSPTQSQSLAPASVSNSPYKEGTTIRNKKDGKLYVVTNGVPVLQEGQ